MKLTEAQWQIMNGLWQQHPATARNLMNWLPVRVSWDFTTVKALLTRLVARILEGAGEE